MAVDDRSVGCLYIADFPLVTRTCPVHVVRVFEEQPPWRHGRALVLSESPYKALVLGLWIRRFRRYRHRELEDLRWINPDYLTVDVDAISTWYRGPDEPVEETAPEDTASESTDA